jgi:hypothetical protein
MYQIMIANDLLRHRCLLSLVEKNEKNVPLMNVCKSYSLHVCNLCFLLLLLTAAGPSERLGL